MGSKIKLISIGKVKQDFIKKGTEHYIKRINNISNIEIVIWKDEGIKKESEKILEYCKNNPNTYILDANGKMYNSMDFSKFFKNIEDKITFIIGGPEGILNEVKSKIKTVSLSKMTFPHEVAKLLLLEQIYRSEMINLGRTYYNK